MSGQTILPSLVVNTVGSAGFSVSVEVDVDVDVGLASVDASGLVEHPAMKASVRLLSKIRVAVRISRARTMKCSGEFPLVSLSNPILDGL